MNKDSNRIDIKDYFQGENQKKGIAIGLMALIAVSMIIFAVSDNQEQEVTDEILNPDREAKNYNSKLEAQGDKPKEVVENDLIYYKDDEVNSDEEIEYFNPNEINDAISNAGNVHNQSTNYNTQSSQYNPYVSKDGYQLVQSKISKQNTNRIYDIEEEIGSEKISKAERNIILESVPKPQKPKVWKNQNYISKNLSESNNFLDTKIYKAAIISNNSKYLTPENNRVQIRVIEPFEVNNVLIPKTTQLIAYASFNIDLKLEIKSILINGKQIPVNISVLDSQGQEAIEIVGGTGAELSNNATREAIVQARTGNNIIDRASQLISSKKKVKAIISSDYVYLRVN